MATRFTPKDAPPDPRPDGGPRRADTARVDPAEMPAAFAYEDTDIPDGMTIADWTRGRAHRHARRYRHRLRRHAQQSAH